MYRSGNGTHVRNLCIYAHNFSILNFKISILKSKGHITVLETYSTKYHLHKLSKEHTYKHVHPSIEAAHLSSGQMIFFLESLYKCYLSISALTVHSCYFIRFKVMLQQQHTQPDIEVVATSIMSS